MVNFSINFAALGPVLLVLVLSLVLGVACALLEAFGGFAVGLFIAVVKGIAGDRSGIDSRRRPKGAIAFRALIYVGLCVGAIVLTQVGHVGWAYVCAIAGGIALPIATGKLLS